MENVSYMPRIIDEELRSRLASNPAVVVRGPKWCGKTSSCLQLAESALMLRDPDQYEQSMEAARIKPSLLLSGKRPRLLDEWQLAPVLWDAVIHEADRSQGAPAQFLLSGSATPPDPSELRHSGTGRIAHVTMSTMTLAESGDSDASVSLARLFENEELEEGASELSLEDYAELICRGGWPAPIAHGFDSASYATDYIDAVCETDIAQASGVRIDPDRARALIRSLARNTAQAASLRTILADVKDAGVGMSEPTLRSYLRGLRSLYFVEEVKAWAPTMRSRTPLRSAPIWHLCDPSLAAAALEAEPSSLLRDLRGMGFLFESLCVHDLRVYGRALGGDVYHFRDKNGFEVDAIMRLRDGRWGAAEIKLGGEEAIETASKHLKSLAGKVDVASVGSPSFLAVITAGRYSYLRPDGVRVIPLGCLGP